MSFLATSKDSILGTIHPSVVSDLPNYALKTGLIPGPKIEQPVRLFTNVPIHALQLAERTAIRLEPVSLVNPFRLHYLVYWQRMSKRFNLCSAAACMESREGSLRGLVKPLVLRILHRTVL